MKSFIEKYFTGLCTAILVVGCGGGGGNSNSVSSMDTDTVQISGAGIKGPLAFADVKIYALDASFPDYYDKTSPISIAMTNQYAEINGLSVPRKVKPPYILTIDGSNGIDLNTGMPPVIDTLITVITDDMLENGRPIFATPLTTLAFHIARLSAGSTQYKNGRAARKAFLENNNHAASLVTSAFVIGENYNIDLFRSPLVINEYTTDLVKQEQAVYHRASIEAFAARVYALSQLRDISTDTLIKSLALDFHNDGVIDGSDNGARIGSIDPKVLSQNPMKLLIPNTPYHIEDLMLLMGEERVLIGTNLGPTFFMDAIAFPEATTSTEVSMPDVTLSIKSIGFGHLAVGGISDPLALTLTNSGTTPLNISNISISSGFTEANNCSDRVPAGGNCIFDIQFVPTTTGDITGKLTIVSDAITSPDSVSLSGTSTDAGGDLINADPPLISPDSPDIIFYNNLNDEIRHTYTTTDLQEFWGASGWTDLKDAVDVVADPDPRGIHNNALRVFYAGNNYGTHSGSGAQWRKRFSGYDELYLAYDVFFEDDAEFVKGGKLPRLLSTGWTATPGEPVDGTDHWTAGLIWWEGGKLASYVYHANMSDAYGDTRFWDDGADGQVYFQPGQWHSIEVRVVMNTPGVLDGRMQGWFDGKLAFDSSEFMWRMPGGEHLDIGEFIFKTMYGGNSSSFAPSTDQHTYFDNFVISTQPITH